MLPSDRKGKPDEAVSLIAAEDPDYVIKAYPEDIIAFIIFWSLAAVVFLQFFTRYVLNDSMAWTEEIARYLLIWVTFVGGAIAIRRGTHIGVEVMLHFLPPGPVRVFRLVIDVISVGFIALLCWFAIQITERMQIQTMMVIDVPMSVVYGGVTFGCFLMLFRSLGMFWANARRRWHPDPDKVDLVID
ncbi:MAG: TRAP transporter small permease [Ferrovibrio sp.]|uniref:TRAP transporter small permease n=1 Tax=Ferrovibrio sp. TaxID=1917215 RepID=UPI00260D3F33|nr:TRAP transporter small permease [Ferrovibrio sp.]MCW0232761.1 TRAP transporter small permease [Ferrovibrio sp.]